MRGIGLEGSWRVGLCEVERNIFHLKLIQWEFQGTEGEGYKNQ